MAVFHGKHKQITDSRQTLLECTSELSSVTSLYLELVAISAQLIIESSIILVAFGASKVPRNLTPLANGECTVVGALLSVSVAQPQTAGTDSAAMVDN